MDTFFFPECSLSNLWGAPGSNAEHQGQKPAVENNGGLFSAGSADKANRDRSMQRIYACFLNTKERSSLLFDTYVGSPLF